MKIHSFSSWLLTSAWVLLSFFICIPVLQAGTPPANQPQPKTPAEASVSFQVISGENQAPLCSGARFSHTELVTSASCMEKIKTYWEAGENIHAIASSGDDYGEVVLSSREDKGTSAGSETGLAILALKSTPEEMSLWPGIHTDETIATNSTLIVHRESDGEPNLYYKRSVENSLIFGGCSGDQCSVHHDEKALPLNDGNAVFSGAQLLCVRASAEHCLRVRSVVKRGADINCRGFSKELRDTECHNVGCPEETTECCLSEGVVSRHVLCNNCSVDPACAGNIGCYLDNVAGSNTCRCTGTEPDGSLFRTSTSCAIADKNFPVTKTVGFIAGVSAGALALVCVAPCIACALCACCGCFACCAGCGACAKSKAQPVEAPMKAM